MTGMTRAADQNFTQATNNATFSVTAFQAGAETNKYFGPLTFTSNGTAFTSADKKYWPEGYNLDFYAYAPIDGASATLATTSATGNQITPDATYGYKKFTVIPSSTVASQADLVFANTNKWGKYVEDGYKNGAAGVAINFRHAGSKICLMVKNSNSALKFEITGWKIVGVDGQAVFTYNTPDPNNSNSIDGLTDGSSHLQYVDWSGNDDAYTCSYSSTFTQNDIVGLQNTPYYFNNAGSPSTSTPDETLNMILIPQQTTKVPVAAGYVDGTANAALVAGSYIALKMVIKDISGNVIATATAANQWAIWPVSFNWEPGKLYKYTIDLAGGGYWESNIDGSNTDDSDLDQVLDGAEIKFVTVTVDNWTDTPSNISM